MIKHLNIKVEGRVQKVSYRYFTQQKAIELNIKGFVKNLKDGSVYIEAEGTSMLLDQFLEWCYAGSPLAKVKTIHIEDADVVNFKTFEIVR